ncbi:MAG: helix-turn-helix domain-containing protein [Planctomycetota bacterium]
MSPNSRHAHAPAAVLEQLAGIDPLATRRELARALRISTRTLDRLRRRHCLPETKIGGSVRIARDAALRALHLLPHLSKREERRRRLAAQYEYHASRAGGGL